MAEYRLTYPSQLTSEQHMLDEVGAILQQHDLSEKLVYRILLAVSEAFCNAYLHGNRRDPNTLIKISIVVNESLITVDIIDEGRGGLEKISNKKPAGPTSENGRGIDLIRHYTDRVEFSEMDQGAIKVSMVFRRKKEFDVKT